MQRKILSTVIFGVLYSIVSVVLVPLASGADTPPPTQIQNPITVNTFTDLLDRLLNILLVFAGPILLIMIGYSALLFMTSGGSTEMVKRAREVLKWALIGFVIIVSARLLINILQAIFGVGV